MTPNMERSFWQRVAKRGPDDCWEWTGYINNHGYGQAPWNGPLRLAHRVSWLLKRGEAPNGFVCHACDNTRCVNPAHLWIGDHKANGVDMSVKGRSAKQGRTHCINGHEYTPENTYIRPSGTGLGRACRLCHNQRTRNAYATMKARGTNA